jgi:hypothetical protein
MILFCATLVFGQSSGNKAELAGTIIDQKSAAVPNATVTARNVGTGFQRETQTGAGGTYRLVALDPGVYELEVKASGFAANKQTDIQLTVGSIVTLNLTLGVEAVTQSVDVAETLISLDVAQPQVGIGAAQITNLPINGRRFQDFATLTPTVQVDPSRGQLSFVGQRGINSNVMLDGSDYSQPFFGGIRGGERSNFSITVPQSAVQEFQVITQGYSPEYGRSTGGILNAITKSGTNDIHGEAFYQIRPNDLSTENPIPFTDPVTRQIRFLKTPETLQQFGGGAGGAIKRDRAFWFGAYEHQFAEQNRQTVFGNLVGFTPDATTQEAFNFYRGLEKPFVANNNAYAVTGRTDIQSDKGHRLTVRYNQSWNKAENAAGVGGPVTAFTNNALSNEGIEGNRTNTGTVQYTHVFSPNLIADVRYSIQYELRPRLANSQTPSVSNFIGAFGARSFLPTTQDDWRNQILASATLTRGRHTMKFGVDASRISTVQTFGFNQFGSFGFVGLTGTAALQPILEIMSVGGPTANRFDDSRITLTRQIGNLLADLGATLGAGFAQDSWKVTNNFSIDFGVRWEGQYNTSPVANNDAVVNLVRRNFPVNGALDPTKINDSANQWMPRAGFTWSPFSKQDRRFVVRGNAGVFYALSPLILFSGPSNNFRTPPGDVSASIGNVVVNGRPFTVYQQLLAAGVDLNRTPLDQLAAIPLDVFRRAQASTGVAVNDFNNASVLLTSPDFRNPRSTQLGLGFDTEAAKNLVVGMQYNQVNTAFLQRNREYNISRPVSIRAIDGRPQYARSTIANRPVPSLNQITVRESTGKALYRGLTFQAQYRTKRLQFGAFYTVSETFSDTDAERDAGGFEYDDVFNLKPEYNYSRLDARHQFTANGLVTLPWGFEFSAISRIRSGLPFTATAGADLNGDQVTNDRPYSAVGVSFLRNSERNRGIANVDIRLLKSINLGEKMRIQFSGEVFNVLDLENVVYGGTAFVYGPGISTTTGQIQAPNADFRRLRNADGTYAAFNQQLGSPLQAQFGVRFFF